jgi:hypothetical protein
MRDFQGGARNGNGSRALLSDSKGRSDYGTKVACDDEAAGGDRPSPAIERPRAG